MADTTDKKLPDIKKETESMGCQVRQALYFVEEFLAGPMCGKCFPCEMGSFEARIRLVNLISGQGSGEDITKLRKIADEMLVTSRCKKGKDTATYMLEWLDSDVFAEHVAGRCPADECAALIQFRVISEKCVMCGDCQDVCKDNAVVGEKRVAYKANDLPFSISQARCTKCGECIKVCPTSAIEKVTMKQVAGEQAETVTTQR